MIRYNIIYVHVYVSLTTANTDGRPGVVSVRACLCYDNNKRCCRQDIVYVNLNLLPTLLMCLVVVVVVVDVVIITARY